MRAKGPQNQEELIAWIQLIRSENVGPVTFFHLLESYGSAQKALEALPELSARGGRKKPLIAASLSDAQKEYAYCQKKDVHMLAYGTNVYPVRLGYVEDAPPLLFAKGDRALFQKPAVAFVGARNASANGRFLTEKWARALSEAGFLVVSGLARGIDTSAHSASLEKGTCGVVAGGVDIFYPPENEALQTEMMARGLVVSENPCGMSPQAQHFPRRNRIISGLSLGVCVVEATLKSGSLITARYALDQNREVFAVPGSPLDPRSEGPNQLISDGAMLVKSAEDLLRHLNPMIQNYGAEETKPQIYEAPRYVFDDAQMQSARDEILSLLSPTLISIDALHHVTSMPLPLIKMVLVELELAGLLSRAPGQNVCLCYEHEKSA